MIHSIKFTFIYFICRDELAFVPVGCRFLPVSRACRWVAYCLYFVRYRDRKMPLYCQCVCERPSSSCVLHPLCHNKSKSLWNIHSKFENLKCTSANSTKAVFFCSELSRSVIERAVIAAKANVDAAYKYSRTQWVLNCCIQILERIIKLSDTDRYNCYWGFV